MAIVIFPDRNHSTIIRILPCFKLLDGIMKPSFKENPHSHSVCDNENLIWEILFLKIPPKGIQKRANSIFYVCAAFAALKTIVIWTKIIPFHFCIFAEILSWNLPPFLLPQTGIFIAIFFQEFIRY